MFGGKALGWMAGTLIWMPGAPGVRWANVPSWAGVRAWPVFPLNDSLGPGAFRGRPVCWAIERRLTAFWPGGS